MIVKSVDLFDNAFSMQLWDTAAGPDGLVEHGASRLTALRVEGPKDSSIENV